MNNLIYNAVNERRLISFNYKGHKRTVEPHTYGVDTNGHVAIRAYQVSGTSESGGIPDWRLFHESEIFNLTVLQSTFLTARTGYVRGDSVFSTIYAQV